MKLSKPTACPECGGDLITIVPNYEMRIRGVPHEARDEFCPQERMLWTFAGGEPILGRHADDVYRQERIRLAAIRRQQEQGHTFEGIPPFSEWSPQLKKLSIEGEELLDREAAPESNRTDAT